MIFDRGTNCLYTEFSPSPLHSLYTKPDPDSEICQQLAVTIPHTEVVISALCVLLFGVETHYAFTAD